MADSNSNRQQKKSSSRQYKCSCGKSYLSNAALFTHVKLKHDGQLPQGGVQKPKQLYHRRGRPSLKMIQQKKIQLQQDRIASGAYISEEKINIVNASKQKYRELYEFLKQIQRTQVIDQSIWYKVEAFKQLQSYMTDNKDKNKQFGYVGVRLGVGIAQFLGQASLNLSNQLGRFQQLVLIFMFLIQYVIDDNDKKEIIHEAPLEFLLQYIGPFITNELKNVQEEHSLQNLWIMRKENAIKVLFCFYHWLVMKNFTQYKLCLDPEYHDNDDDFLF